MVMIGSVRTEDRLPGGVQPDGSLDPGPLVGTWYATDKSATGLVRIVLSGSAAAGMSVRVFGAAEPEPLDWGEVRATTYGDSVVARQAMAFSALYDFGFLTTLLAAYGKQGILVVDTFNAFKDGSGRTAYFSREFFHR